MSSCRRPEHPGTPISAKAIRRLRERQRAYDRDPEAYCRRQEERRQRRRELERMERRAMEKVAEKKALEREQIRQARDPDSDTGEGDG